MMMLTRRLDEGTFKKNEHYFKTIGHFANQGELLLKRKSCWVTVSVMLG